jgi:glycosyltransferase involved in cell wall biosynthesis
VRDERGEVRRRDAGEVERLLRVPRERIDVVPNGVGTPPDVAARPEAQLRQELAAGERPIVLCTSAKRPHKNLARLLDAFARLEVEPAPVLLVPGYATRFEEELRRRAGDRVRFAGWVDDATLEGLHRIATCSVFPSLAEGFGLPVLEAMSRGTPVACSNTSSLPEVAGEAALYFDPRKPAEIAAAVTQLLSNRELAADLVRRGHERVRLFSWRKAAEETLASYDRART